MILHFRHVHGNAFHSNPPNAQKKILLPRAIVRHIINDVNYFNFHYPLPKWRLIAFIFHPSWEWSPWRYVEPFSWRIKSRAATANGAHKKWQSANSAVHVAMIFILYCAQEVSARLQLGADRYSRFLRAFLRPLNLQVGADVRLRRFLSFAFPGECSLTGQPYVPLRHWSFPPSSLLSFLPPPSLCPFLISFFSR